GYVAVEARTPRGGEGGWRWWCCKRRNGGVPAARSALSRPPMRIAPKPRPVAKAFTIADVHCSEAAWFRLQRDRRQSGHRPLCIDSGSPTIAEEHSWRPENSLRSTA